MTYVKLAVYFSLLNEKKGGGKAPLLSKQTEGELEALKSGF